MAQRPSSSKGKRPADEGTSKLINTYLKLDLKNKSFYIYRDLKKKRSLPKTDPKLNLANTYRKIDLKKKRNLANTYLTHAHTKYNLKKKNTNKSNLLTLSGMDTSSSMPARKNIRAVLTEQYEARVASTLEKMDPNRAKARTILKEDDMEVEALDGEWEAYKDPLPNEALTYAEAPLLTLRQLMPGLTAEDDAPELDQTFRADKVEFMVVQRPLSPPEVEANQVLKDAADVDWSIPDQSEYCLLYTSPSPRDRQKSRMPSSA